MSSRSEVLLLACLTVLLAAPAAAQAPNEHCYLAAAVANGEPAFIGDNSGAEESDALEATCLLDTNYDVWFLYSASCSGLATVDTFGSAQVDPALSAYHDCDSLDFACNDDAGDSLQASLTFPVQAGQFYFIRLASHAAPGAYRLNIACLPIPANDTCATPAPLGVGPVATSGDNTLAASDGLPPGCQPSAGADVWYSYIAPCTGLTTIDTLGSAQADPVLTIYDTCGGAELACNDDLAPFDGEYQSRVIFPAVSGQTYLVRLASYGAPGPYQLNVACLGSPGNDDCSGAATVAAGTAAASGDNSLAGPDLLEVACAPTDYDVWFEYSSCGGIVSIDTVGSAQLDPVLSVYDACGGAELACNDDGPFGDYQSRLQLLTTPGQTLRIRLASRAAPGPYQLNISCLAPPANDDCGTPLAVAVGSPAAAGDNSLAGPDAAEAPCQPDSDSDVWFLYTAAEDGVVTVDTLGSGQPDTVLSVHSACDGAELACNDDQEGTLLARVTFVCQAGESYLIRLASYAAPGPYRLNIALLAAPSNQTCGAAIVLSEGQPAAVGDNSLAADDVTAATCIESGRHAVWYDYTAGCPGQLTIDTLGSAQRDTVITLYDECGGVEVACGDDTDGAQQAIVSFAADVGQRVLIRVSSGAAPGPFQLNIRCEPNRAPTVFINAPLDGAAVRPGDGVYFAGTAGDAEDGELSDLLEWTSDLDGVIGQGRTFTRQLSRGVHRIEARVSDSYGELAAASATLKVFIRGDANCDGLFNNFDIDPFVFAMVFPQDYPAAYNGCPIETADINGDLLVNMFDVDPFVNCILNGCP